MRGKEPNAEPGRRRAAVGFILVSVRLAVMVRAARPAQAGN